MTLTEGRDFTVTYIDNIEVGDTAAAIISGSRFLDSVTKYFSITKAHRGAPTGLTAVAGAATTFAGYAVKVGSDFEAGMSKVRFVV